MYIGQLESYEQSAEIAERLLGVEISDTSIHRMTDSMGGLCADWLSEESLRDDLGSEDRIYVQIDGSMVLTREHQWKEVKLGRVFGSSSHIPLNGQRNWLIQSEYISHLGEHHCFEQKMSAVVDAYSSLDENLVFINDGAKWQWNWIEAEYPSATQILDFYHAMGHVGKYLMSLLKRESKKVREDFIAHCATILKEQGVDRMWQQIEEITDEQKLSKTILTERQKLRGYLENNRKRMDYPAFIKRNLLIGSGAIESAHRTVIQKRMKLSGQRWSMDGAKNMLNLRTLNMSGHWDRLVRHMTKAA